MNMINSFDEWKGKISELSNWKYNNRKTLIYRGHKRDTYVLKPSIARFDNDPEQLKIKEKKILDLFYKKLTENNKTDILTKSFSKAEFHNIWINLFQAQHLGLPTRLLDWTPGPEIALYFATERDDKEYEDDDSFNGVVWVYPCDNGELIEYNNEVKLQSESPFNLNKTKILNPSFLCSTDFNKKLPEQRRFHQGGRFIIQPYNLCTEALEFQEGFEKKLQKIVISKTAKKEIRDKLDEMKINWDKVYRDNDMQIKDIINEMKIILESH